MVGPGVLISQLRRRADRGGKRKLQNRNLDALRSFLGVGEVEWPHAACDIRLLSVSPRNVDGRIEIFPEIRFGRMNIVIL